MPRPSMSQSGGVKFGIWMQVSWKLYHQGTTGQVCNSDFQEETGRWTFFFSIPSAKLMFLMRRKLRGGLCFCSAFTVFVSAATFFFFSLSFPYLCHLSIYCPSASNLFALLCTFTAGLYKISPLLVGSMLGFINRGGWRNMSRYREEETSLSASEVFYF